jgi:predicted amidohydrolase
MRVAAVQLASTPDRDRNLAVAERLVQSAAADGARLVVLPETFNVLGDHETMRRAAETLDGPTLTRSRDLARRLGIWLVAGSILERVAGDDRVFNTACLIEPGGEIRAAYRKIHLFDCDVPGATLQESRVMRPGSEIVTVEVDGLPVGLAICYDLRFPELFRILTLRGAQLIVLPAAFTERTGRDHWEVLLRARAIENQVGIVAANQVGGSGSGPRWYGRSMIVDPWGLVRAQAPDEETGIVADLEATVQAKIRAQLPCLTNRQPETYVWPEAQS